MREPTSTTSPLGRLRAMPLALGALGLLASVEWVAAARAYRTTITADDWAAVREIIGEPDQPDQPDRDQPTIVFAETPWLDPVVRAEIPAAGRADVVGRPDLRGAPEYWTVAASGQLRADRRGSSAPLERTEIGGLVLSHYPADAERIVDRLRGDGLLVEGAGKRCRPRKRGFDCRPGRVETAFVEVDYEARRCLAARGFEGRTVSFTRTMTLGQTIVGHVGFGDFNARLRSDAPVRVEVAIDGQPRLRTVVTDTQGWWPYELPTAPGSHTVTVALTPALGGQFGPEGQYTPRSARTICVELRSLEARTAGGEG